MTWAGVNQVTGKAILADVDMLAMVSPDDPPVFLFSAGPEGEPEVRGQYLHHPKHARTVKAACDAAGVPATAYFAQGEPHPPGDYRESLRQFLFTQLKL